MTICVGLSSFIIAVSWVETFWRPFSLEVVLTFFFYWGLVLIIFSWWLYLLHFFLLRFFFTIFFLWKRLLIRFVLILGWTFCFWFSVILGFLLWKLLRNFLVFVV